MAKKISYNEIQSIQEDWSRDERNGYPYSGRSVQNFIKKQLSGKGGDFYYDADTSKYLIFSDKENRDLYLSDRETYADLLLGSFDAPANYTAKIFMVTPLNNTILSGTTGNYIEFTFDITDKDGVSTGDAVIATFTFNNAGNIRKATQIYEAGSAVRFLVDSYLSDGTNNVSVAISGRNTLAGAIAVVRYTVVALNFTSDFDFSKPVHNGQYLTIPYTLEGIGVKYIEWYIDGVKEETEDAIADIRVNRTKNIEISGMTIGKHNVQARTYIMNNDELFYSKTLYFDFVVAPTNDIWEAYSTFILLSLVLGAPVLAEETISISVKQYESFEYGASIYDSRGRSLPLVVFDNGTQMQSIVMVSGEIQNLKYSPTEIGTHTITFSADTASAEMSADVKKSDVGIEEITDGLILKLSAKGRSNSETNPAVWTYGNITTTFNGFRWDERCGWFNDMLVVDKGASLDISVAPLGGNPLANGRTIIIDYETTDTEEEGLPIISLVNASTGAGLIVTASTAQLQASSGANVNTKYNDGDRVNLAFIVNRTSGDNGRLMFIVNNGILERAAEFTATDSFQVSSNLHIEGNGCIVKIHSIRIYDRALTAEESFCNFAIDSGNVIEVANRNDILNETTRQIDADKVNIRLPILIITGDMTAIFTATDKNATAYVDVEYKDMQDPTKNFTATHSRFRPQGTSSLGYPRKNLRMYTSTQYGCVMTDANGEALEDGLYAFKDNSQPVNCWTLKADYAESSGSHNTGVARLWNELMYNAQLDGEFVLRTEAQKKALESGYNYDVRTTVDGFPIVVFHRQTADSELVCLGQYNFNNDKSTEKVFGFTDIPGFDNTNVQCFEVLDSSKAIALFTDISNFDDDWDESFESRYPDTKNPNLAPLKTLATWINSCKDNQQKWNSEKSQHFDLPKLAAYYVYLMRFGAVDQTVKNSMLTTEDGVHWFFINYDNDTILGIDNASKVFNAWSYNRQSIVPSTGEYYYAGHDSVLWNCLEADDECMALVRRVDDALYTAGLRYANLNNMFDVEQCDKWCERIYNDNGSYKYIRPFKDSGAPYLYMLQGSRKSYRHWWIQHRMDMFDAMWASAAYRNRQTTIRFNQSSGTFSGHSFTITAAIESFFGYGINNVVQASGISLDVGDTHTFEISEDIGIGNPINLYNANNIDTIQLHGDSISLLRTFDISSAVGNNGASRLKRIILGDGTLTNSQVDVIGGLSVITGLEEIDVRGFLAMTNINLDALQNLHIFNGAGSGLTSFAPARGVTLTSVSLPSALQSITLYEARVEEINYTPTKSLRNVSLRSVGGTWSAQEFVNSWLALFTDEELAELSLTLHGINWAGLSAAQVLKIGKVGTKSLQGKITLTSITLSEYEQIVDVFGANVFTPGGSFVIDAPAGILLTGPTSLKDGDTGQYTATAFPISEATIEYLLYNGTQLVASQTDGQGRVYRKLGGITLYEATGVITVDDNITTTTNAAVRAHVAGTSTYSEYLAVTAQPITFPSSINITGSDSLQATGDFNYTKSFDTDNYNAQLQSVVWSLSSTSSASILNQSANDATLRYPALPAATETITLTCTATFERNHTVVGTKQISLVVNPVQSFGLSGSGRVQGTGTYQYLIAGILPDNSNVDIVSLSASISSTTGTMTVTPNGIAGVTLDVTAMPSESETVTITVVATLANGSQVVSTKSVKFGELTGFECVYQGNGSSEVQIIGNYFSLDNVLSMSVDGVLITPTKKYVFNDTEEHTVNIEVSNGNSTYYLFGDCTKLKSCVFGNDITSIPSAFFSGCTGLQHLAISKSVTTINNLYIYTTKLESIIIDSANPVFDSRNNCNAIITTASNTLLYGCKSTVIPSGITSIGSSAFYGITGLTSVTIPNSVTIIGDRAFYNCSGLTSVTIGSSVTNIGDSAFSGCSGLTSVTIPNSVTSIKNAAFYNCTGLETITIGNMVSEIGSAFHSCYKISTIICYSVNAPIITNYTFTSIGTQVPSGTAKTLNVPAGSTGYDSGYWQTTVIDKGYTLNATL